VLRSVSRYLAGVAIDIPEKGVSIKRNHVGLPTIIPTKLLNRIMNFSNTSESDRRIVVCILTLLSVFRVFPTKPKVSLQSIVEPFNGTVETLSLEEIRKALKDLHIRNPVLKRPQFLKLETSSPNCSKST
jgi:hypothetical protein